MRVLFIAVIAAFVMSTSAEAAVCKPGSREELAQMLAKHHHFHGKWSLAGYTGPVDMKFSLRGGTLKLSAQSSDKDGKLTGYHSYTPKITSATGVAFTLKAKVNGRVQVRLQSNCSLRGSQTTPYGSITLRLSPR